MVLYCHDYYLDYGDDGDGVDADDDDLILRHLLEKSLQNKQKK